MRNFIKIVLLLTINFSFAQKVSTSQAINIIGKQCMLSQRMATKKVYLYETKKISQIKLQLSASIIQFEQNTAILGKMPLLPEIHQKIKTIELLWYGYKENISSESSNANKNLVDYYEIMLDGCKDVQNMLYDYAKENNQYPYTSNNSKEFIEAYKCTNDIKYLSQKLSLIYNIYYYKVKQYNKEVFDAVIEEIDEKINAALAMKGTNIRLSEKVDSLEYDWKNLKAILYNVMKEDFISVHNSPKPDEILKECNNFLKDADLLIREYKSINDINK